MASLEAVEEAFVELIGKVDATDARDEKAIRLLTDEIRRNIARWELAFLPRWDQVDFAPRVVRDVDDPEGWRDLELEARRRALAETRAFLCEVCVDIAARPREPAPNVLGCARTIFGEMVGRVRKYSSTSQVMFSPSSFLEVGVSRRDSGIALQLLKRRDLVDRLGMDSYAISEHGRDVVDGVRTIDDVLPLQMFTPQAPDNHNTQTGPEAPMGISIFISHSSLDEGLAVALVDFIEGSLEVRADAIRCTSVEGHKPDIGENTPELLRENLKSCAVVIVLLTSASRASSFVLLELGAAWALKKPCLPLLGPGVSFDALPGPFRDVQTIRLVDESGIAGLRETLAKLTGFPQRNAAKAQGVLRKFLTVLQGATKAEAQATSAGTWSSAVDPTARPMLSELNRPGATPAPSAGFVRDFGEFVSRLAADDVTTFVALIREGRLHAAAGDELRLRWGTGAGGRALTEYATARVDGSTVEIKQHPPQAIGEVARVLELMQTCRLAAAPLQAGVTTSVGFDGSGSRWSEAIVVSSGNFAVMAGIVERAYPDAAT